MGRDGAGEYPVPVIPSREIAHCGYTRYHHSSSRGCPLVILLWITLQRAVLKTVLFTNVPYHSLIVITLTLNRLYKTYSAIGPPEREPWLRPNLHDHSSLTGITCCLRLLFESISKPKNVIYCGLLVQSAKKYATHVSRLSSSLNCRML